jgi:lipopolysaccharide assembly protein A
VSYVSWIFKFLIFLLLLGFALNNLQPVDVSYYFAFQWRLPLVVVILLALVVGAVLGLLAATGPLYRQRRQIQQLKREMRVQEITAGKAAAEAKPANIATS